jgi:3'-phosphoadenosine 5'-phosphosulfate sulfotransferase (PAPS reductase)/FAD synthetase
MNNIDSRILQAQTYLLDAIDQWNPDCIVCTFSGGHDSMVTTDIVNNMKLNIPVKTCSVDTQLSLDGWRKWVLEVGREMEWDIEIFDGDFKAYLKWVEINGCPRTPSVHKYVFSRLKGVAFAQMLKKYKNHHRGKVLFVSGVYRAESSKRSQIEHVISRQGKSNAVWASICFDWSKSDFVKYRLIKNLPENPFYEKGKGSGDCNCNWGDFLTYDELLAISPKLANGNVKIIDEISRKHHGYGWNSSDTTAYQTQAPDQEAESEDFPFLCDGCSRSSHQKSRNREIESEMQMRMIEW